MEIQGKVFLFGDNIDTDVIIPAQYCITTDETYLAQHCMYDIKDHFYKSVNKGDIIVAGENFGCGSSREAAPIALMACGISCVIAKSFSRIFYRNAINLGLNVIENSKIYDMLKEGDILKIDLSENNIYMNGTFMCHINNNNSTIVSNIIKEKGLINYLIANNLIEIDY